METGGLRSRPIERLGSSLEWFEEQLARRGLRAHPASAFARSVARIRALRAREIAGESTKYDSTDAAVDEIADVFGIDFLTKAVHWGVSSGLVISDDRWRDMLGGEPSLVRQARSSKERDQTWEIVIGSIAATFATDVTFGEPDVTCAFQGKRFAVAAKVAYSQDKVRERVIEGFRQAEGQGHVEASLVFVNVVQLLPIVDTLRWSRTKDFRDNDEAVEAMKAAAMRWCSNFDLEGWARDLGRRATRPIGVAFFMPMFLHTFGAPRPFFYSHLPVTWSDESTDRAFVTAFLQRCNDVLGFLPSPAETPVSRSQGAE